MRLIVVDDDDDVIVEEDDDDHGHDDDGQLGQFIVFCKFDSVSFLLETINFTSVS
jgi:hypothetical protein